MDKLFRKIPLVASFAKPFKRGSRQKAYLDEPAERQITAGIVCFGGWIAGPNPISALTLEIGDHSEIISTFHERADVLEATGASHAVGWRVFVHIPPRATGAASLKVRILVGGVLLFKRTLMCLPRRNGRSAAPLIFCMHIPKTAGTSLRTALDAQPELRALRVYPEDPFISSTRCFELGPDAFDEIDVVIGHFAHGFHAISHRPYRYVSIVREPFAMLSSHYLHAKYLQKVPHISRYSTIYEAAERSAPVEFDNVLTRYFANRLDNEPVSEDDFIRAKRTIQNDFEYIVRGKQ